VVVVITVVVVVVTAGAVVVVTAGAVVVVTAAAVVVVTAGAVVVVTAVVVVAGRPLRVVVVVLGVGVRCAGFLESALRLCVGAGACMAGAACIRGGWTVGRSARRGTVPPHSVVRSRAMASEWCPSSSQPVSATLPIRKAAPVVTSTRCQRDGMRAI
jgi:hypothetical protein